MPKHLASAVSQNHKHKEKNTSFPYLKAGFSTKEQNERADRRREQTSADWETAELLMNYMITCYGSELFIQVKNHLGARQTLKPSPSFLPLFYTPLLLFSSLPLLNTTATITRTDVCCNPVAPFTVDTWRCHLDQRCTSPDWGVCLCVHECTSEKKST